MSPPSINTLRLIPKLEKVKAGLGAAGMAAMAIQSIALLWFGGGDGWRNLTTVGVAVLSGVVAWHSTSVSEKEVKLELAVGRESILSDDATK